VNLPAEPVHRSGFAALVGRPNVGKSTLLNALVGQKLSIVTPRPQTTRHRILGLYSTPQVQIAFLDTPGLHREASRALNKAMNRTATAALEEADVVVLVLEALKWTAEDDLALERLKRSGRAAIAAVNKVDRVRPRERKPQTSFSSCSFVNTRSGSDASRTSSSNSFPDNGTARPRTDTRRVARSTTRSPTHIRSSSGGAVRRRTARIRASSSS